MAVGLVVVALGGPTADTALLRDRIAGASLFIAADGGALRLAELGLRADVVTGDFDSLSPAQREALAADGVEIVPHPDPQQQTDGAVALQLAVERGAQSIVVLGAHGGDRLDHSLGNLLALLDETLAALPISVVDGWNEAVGLRAGGRSRVIFEGLPGDYVSLLPVSQRVRVRSLSLRWPLEDALVERGTSQALSNELRGESGGFELLDGAALATHTFRQPEAFAGRPR